jgi:BirA family biotin operon repressor/biotin-[acetyl-CoA-carboxylase] ligase
VLDDLGLQIQSGSLPATLATRIVGHDVRYVAQTGSTNHDLKLLARRGVEEGLMLVTDEQTQGRGRRGRTWSAPPGSSLLSSTLLRPTWLPPSDAFYLTILAAVTCAEAIQEATSLQVELKWPNDLQVQERKLGGILVETEVTGNILTWAILGIGLNVDWDIASVPELAVTATTLAAALGRPVSRAHLLTALIRHLDDRYVRLRAGERQRLFEDWRTRLTTLGRAVRAEAAGRTIEGYAEAVTPDGSLVIRDHAGTRHELTAGDVTIRSDAQSEPRP